MLIAGCGKQEPAQTADGPAAADVMTAEQATQLQAEIKTFCGACHQVPAAEMFAQEAWYKEVNRGYDFYVDSGRNDLIPPPLAQVVDWYRQRAPETLPRPEPLPSAPGDLRFQSQSIPTTDGAAPMIAEILWDGELRLCDMANGLVTGVDPNDIQPQAVCKVLNACRSRRIDLDGDSIPDLLVSDLGSRTPSDHTRGSLQFFSGQADASFASEGVVLLDQIGRVVDCAPADFDQIGDLDLIVVEFGWMKTGGIHLLENQCQRDASGRLQMESGSFKVQRIDPRHGAISVEICDLNNDSFLDALILFSQEFETIDVFLGNGDLTFRRETVMPAQDPAFGSCSMDLADIDGDGDPDIVYCNGDTLDSMTVKHYHGVHLLRNNGLFPFDETRLLTMPGASDAVVADLDNDGD
ncbi:MAG: VCBS repeat-containing protein, partial [Planctomycetaceae bacterium]|nr:VCBS repeat-containing protein [Planctomycetaceae bacterium]